EATRFGFGLPAGAPPDRPADVSGARDRRGGPGAAGPAGGGGRPRDGNGRGRRDGDDQLPAARGGQRDRVPRAQPLGGVARRARGGAGRVDARAHAAGPAGARRAVGHAGHPRPAQRRVGRRRGGGAGSSPGV
ncbi:MAG: hypothetical protein AVDCRST_MAG64-1316, partial [uncultured Phycisphaerae bacterium]